MANSLNSLIERFAVEMPHRIAIVSGSERMSFAQFADAIDEVARKFVALGLRPGERVALLSENSPEYLVALFAIWRAGGIAAGIFPSFGSSELAYALQNAEPRFALADAERIEMLQNVARETKSNVQILPLGSGLLDDVVPATSLLPEIDESAPALICYTSGTSSRPKPVLHSHSGLCHSAEAFADTWRVTASDSSLVAVPLVWLFGLITATGSVMCRGGTIVVFRRFAADQVLDALARERVSIFVGVTTMYIKLMEQMHATRNAPDLALRFCISGGEPRNEVVFEKWRSLIGARVYDSYCGSESFPVVTSDPVVDPEPPLGSSGRIMNGAQIKLVDTKGNPVAPGEIGEALTRGPALMLEYWNEPELTAAALTEDGWFRTRDYLRIDENGHVFVVGRASDMIIRGGTNISPMEVEAVLNSFPATQESAVFGLSDARYGQTVAAAIVPKTGTTIDVEVLRAFCVGKLASYKVPTTIKIFEKLPRNESGKVVRKDIVALFG